MDRMNRHRAAFLVWIDFSKLGRLSHSDLNWCVDVAASILAKKPLVSAVMIVCPILPSEKVKNGLRGEVRCLWKSAG